MLQPFTWQQFLIAALILSTVWYSFILLVYYRKGSRRFWPRSRSSNEQLPHSEITDRPDNLPEEENALMGRPAEPEGVKTCSMDDFGFAAKTAEAEEAAGKPEQMETVPDVLEELKEIFRVLEKEDGSKAEFFSLLALVKAKYPKIRSSPNLQHINEFIRERIPFLLTKEEFENLWD